MHTNIDMYVHTHIYLYLSIYLYIYISIYIYIYMCVCVYACVDITLREGRGTALHFRRRALNNNPSLLQINCFLGSGPSCMRRSVFVGLVPELVSINHSCIHVYIYIVHIYIDRYHALRRSRRGASFPSPCTQHIRSHKQTRCRPLFIALPGWHCHVPGRDTEWRQWDSSESYL